jgi:hypothetical protein
MHGTASREHILPQWLHPHIEMPGVSIQHRAVSEQGATLLRSHDLNNFTVKSICAKCNSGWMSQLEADVKPTLLSLIEGRRSAASLDLNEATLVARWAFKTAFMLLPGQKTNIVPWSLFERWAAAGAGGPDPAIIFALSNLQSTRGFGYIMESDDLADSTTHPVNLRISICVGSLLLVVLLPLDDNGRTPGLGHPLYRLLWPPDAKPIYIPTEINLFPDSTYGEFIKYLAGFVHAGVPTVRGSLTSDQRNSVDAGSQ